MNGNKFKNNKYRNSYKNWVPITIHFDSTVKNAEI